MDAPAVLIRVPAPEPCEAAQCGVPVYTEVVFTIPLNAHGGVRRQHGVCFGHYLAFQHFVDRYRRMGVDLRMQTLAEVAAERAQPRVNYTFTTSSTYGSNSVYTNAFGWH